MRTTSLASVGRIRRSTTLASMTRLLPENPNILTPEYQMDYISAFQHGGCAALSAHRLAGGLSALQQVLPCLPTSVEPDRHRWLRCRVRPEPKSWQANERGPERPEAC